MPALVLDKLVVRTQVHGQWFPAVGADGEQLWRDFHIFLPLDHFPDDRFVIKGLLTARLTALEQTVIALRVEQPLFIKARLLKAVIHIGRDNEIILVLHQLQKIIVDRFGGIHIAVDVDVPAPIRPEFFHRGEGIEAAAVHILNAVLLRKVGEMLLKPFAGVSEARRRGQSCTCADDHGITVL